MRNRNIFEQLRERLVSGPERKWEQAGIDRRFWERFESEFGKPRHSFGFWIPRAIAIAATLTVVIGGVALLRDMTHDSGTDSQLQHAAQNAAESAAENAPQNIALMIENREFLQNFEVFAELDDLALSATDAEWEQLVGPSSGEGDANESG